MKKRILTIMAVLLIISLLAVPAAYAAGQGDGTADGQDNAQNNSGQNHGQSDRSQISERLQKWQDKQEEWASKHHQLLARRMELSQLRTATRDQIRDQQQLMDECKDQIRQMLHDYEDLSQEERTQCRQQLQLLRGQMLDAHQYCLALRNTTRLKARDIFAQTTAAGAPENNALDIVGTITNELA